MTLLLIYMYIEELRVRSIVDLTGILSKFLKSSNYARGFSLKQAQITEKLQKSYYRFQMPHSIPHCIKKHFYTNLHFHNVREGQKAPYNFTGYPLKKNYV